MAAPPELPSSTDVTIIGGGIMGTSTAYFLTEHTDLEVTVVEKNAIASGSTGDSSAILRHHYGPQEIYTQMAWWSHQFYRAFPQETGEPIAHEENPLVRAVNDGTASAEYAMAGYNVLNGLEIPASRYEPADLEERFPMFDFGDFDFAVSDDAAGYSDGSDAANGFARAARRNGATIVTGVEVTDFEVADDAIRAVITENGRLECGSVVLAAGPWTARLAGRLGIELPLLIEREQVIILEPSEQYGETFPSLTPTTALPGGEWYIRPDFGEGILVATHHTRDEVDPDRYSNQPDEAMLLELTAMLEEVIPEIGDAGIRGRYCGLYSTTPDHDFIIDQAGPENCYIACGFSGHGFKHGPAVGRILTDLIVDGETDFVDIEYFSLARFEDDPAGHGLPADLA